MRQIWCVACCEEGSHMRTCPLSWAPVVVILTWPPAVITAFFTSHSAHPWTFRWIDIPMYFEPMGILQSNQHPGKWFWDITDTCHKALMGHDLIHNAPTVQLHVAIAPTLNIPPPPKQPQVDPAQNTPQQLPETGHSTPQTWKHGIQNITDIMCKDKALKYLRSWLGAKPSDFLHTRPLMYTLWEVLNCLMAEYNPVGDKMKVANMYCLIKQNTKSISDHHSEVYMLL